jgi:hypothetical protein
MKNTSEYPKESLTQSSRALMKNKARLSTKTAFSFGYHLKHLTIDLVQPLQTGSFHGFLAPIYSEK